LADNYFRFWCRFVSIILREGTLPGFEKEYQTYMGYVFEEFWRRTLPRFVDVERVGSWWHKEDEVDVVGIKGKEVYALEVKWASLREREAKRFTGRLWRKVNREPFEGYNVGLGVIAKQVEEKELLREEGYLLFDLKDLP
jgi:AAA+ ATPase superfamily predicted ATPase